jgi:sn-glycerol 3-phosphate transport system ATP-binding protein
VSHRDLAPGRAVVAGIRAEDCSLEPGAGAALPVMVDFSEELGAVRLLHGQACQQDFVVQVPADPRMPREGRLTVSVPAGAVHVFDARTGRRIAPAEPDRAAAAA